MAERITRNTFEKGRNTDVSKSKLDPVLYTEAHNLEIVGDGEFLALKNIKGTVEVETITAAANTEVLSIFDTKFKIGSTYDVKSLLIFTINTSTNVFKIWAYATTTDTLYELFQETVSGYIADDRIIEARGYAENRIDLVQFTDFFGEMRQLRCEIPSPYVANFLNDYDLSLQRRGANGTVVLASDVVMTGGSLLSGTYQFVYRMVDVDAKRFTKWSSLTNPIHIYDTDSVNGAYASKAGVGLFTDKKIRLDVTPTADELTNFPYFQLAVIENIYPLNGASLNASLLPITAIGSRTNYEYKSNYRVGLIPIEDLTVDLAAIKKVKTLAIKQNKLFAGNVEYHSLTLNNGTPTTAGSVTTAVSTPATLYWDGIQSTLKKGYFRDETYRFAIVYRDKYGNRSTPSVLDMSSITGNIITGSTDMRFPSRSTSGSYSVLDSSDCPRGLGLSLTNIVNHPTWAVGFEIVRVKRIKRVLFQSPVIPFMAVKGVGSLYDYPGIQRDATNAFEYPDAQPMTNSKVYVPKNLAWPELRNIDEATAGGVDAQRILQGEVKLERGQTYQFAGVFPPSNMYGETAYNYFGGEKLQTIDFCVLRIVNPTFSGVYQGDGFDTNRCLNFYATLHGDYYFHNGWTAKTISETDRSVTDYAYFDNLSEGGIVGGQKVFQYEELNTKGVTFGQKPSVNRMAVMQVSSPLTDEGSTSRTFSSGQYHSYFGGSPIFGGTTPVYQTNLDNNFVTTYAGFSAGSYVQQLRIVNVVNESVDDTRYGDIQSQHEYISTGAVYTFSPSELTQVQAGTSTPISIDVWGGDCFVSFHTFQVSNSTYSVINQDKSYGVPVAFNTLMAKWGGKIYRTTAYTNDSAYMIPVALDNVGQLVQVCLESEYNGEVLDNSKLYAFSTSSSTNVMNVADEAQIRTPMSYAYNINLNKENDQKVYLSKPTYTLDQNIFNSRILISDQKIYNSDQQGFDVFRVLNFTDLEESKGAITKLALGNDNLYAIQERAIVYLPTGQTQLEQTDAGILSVGTGSDIGRPIVIDANRGGQNLAAIKETGSAIYIPDLRNKAVYQLVGQELTPISSLGNETLFRSFFVDSIVDRTLVSVYDPIRKEYWLARNSTTFNCHVFNELLNQWVSNYEFGSSSKLYGGVLNNLSLYLIGSNGTNIAVSRMYEGNYNTLFGQTVTPRVTFVVNPDNDFSKTFDNLMFSATDRLATVDLVVEREAALGNQTVTGTSIDVAPVEGNYRVKILRDSASARLRGLRMSATVKWLTTNVTSALSSVYTKFRHSKRAPF